MKNYILILLFLILQINLFSQKTIYDKLKIKYDYSQVIKNNDTVNIKRTPQEGFSKLNEKDYKLMSYIQQVETSLSNIWHGNQEVSFNDLLNKSKANIENLKNYVFANKINLIFIEYNREVDFLEKYPVKSSLDKRKEIVQKIHEEGKIKYQKELEEKEKLAEYNRAVGRRNDSIVIIKKREQEVFDSIEDVRQKQEVKEQIAKAAIQKKHNSEISAKKKIETEEKNKQKRITIIEKYGSVNGEAILNHQVKIGWTKAMCKESWGNPRDINKTTTAHLINEQWVYSLKKYLYFDNGILTAFQE